MTDATTIPSPRDELAPRDTRWDALRAVAILAVVGLHAAGPYCARPHPGLPWPVFEPARPLLAGDGHHPGAALTDLVFWIARSFAVPLFFYAAGVLGARSLRRDGPSAFLASRARRLLVPLVAGLVCVVPVMYFVWAWGWVRFGWAAWEHVPHIHFGPAIQEHLFGPGHFWFLISLCVSFLLLAPMIRLVDRVPIGARLALLAIPVVALVGAGASAASVRTLHAFPNSFIPHPGFFAYHFVFLLWGAAASRSLTQDSPRRGGVAWGAIVLALGLGVAGMTTTSLVLGLRDAPNEGAPIPPGVERRAVEGGLMALAGALAVHGWSVLCARGGWALRIAPLGRASLWVYTTHLVWVGLCAVLLYRVPVVSEVKALLVFVAGVSVPVITRDAASRTRVGRWLGA